MISRTGKDHFSYWVCSCWESHLACFWKQLLQLHPQGKWGKSAARSVMHHIQMFVGLKPWYKQGTANRTKKKTNNNKPEHLSQSQIPYHVGSVINLRPSMWATPTHWTVTWDNHVSAPMSSPISPCLTEHEHMETLQKRLFLPPSLPQHTTSSPSRFHAKC